MTLKKPVKPTDKIIAAAVAKRKTLLRYVRGNLKSGDLASLNKQIIDFAKKNDVSPNDLKFSFGYYNSTNVSCRRLETEAEKYERVKYALNSAYQTKKYAWDLEQRQIKQQREQAEATLRRLNVQTAPVHNVSVNCCNCKCR